MGRAKRVSAGDVLTEIPAHVYNTLLDLVDEFHARREGREAALPATASKNVDLVLVRNNTGSDRSAGEVIGLGDLVFDLSDADEYAEAFEHPVCELQLPQWPDHLGKFGVLVDAVRDGEVGLAAVGGRVLVPVDFGDATLPFADVTHNSAAKLTAREFGGARILAKESGSGVKKAWVQLGTLWMPKVFGTLDEDLVDGSTADFSVKDEDTSGALNDTGRTATVGSLMLPLGTTLANGSDIWTEPTMAGILELLQSPNCAG